MQEEIEHKTVNFAISTVKLSARTLLKGAQFFLRQYDKGDEGRLRTASSTVHYRSSTVQKLPQISVNSKEAPPPVEMWVILSA